MKNAGDLDFSDLLPLAKPSGTAGNTDPPDPKALPLSELDHAMIQRASASPVVEYSAYL